MHIKSIGCAFTQCRHTDIDRYLDLYLLVFFCVLHTKFLILQTLLLCVDRQFVSVTDHTLQCASSCLRTRLLCLSRKLCSDLLFLCHFVLLLLFFLVTYFIVRHIHQSFITGFKYTISSTYTSLHGLPLPVRLALWTIRPADTCCCLTSAIFRCLLLSLALELRRKENCRILIQCEMYVSQSVLIR